MHKGRYYPQILQRWKYIDFQPPYWIPRQVGAIINDYAGTKVIGWQGFSDIEKETDDDLLHFYNFAPLESSHKGTLQCWFNGDNDLDVRGLYMDWRDDSPYRQLLRFWTEFWPTCKARSSSDFEHVDELVGGPIGGDMQIVGQTAVDWKLYPMDQTWILTPGAKLSRGRTRQTRHSLDRSNEERFYRARYAAAKDQQKRAGRLSSKL